MGREYQVRDLARIANVTVRALHHYDAIALLKPSGRTAAGYRLYREAELLRLQQIQIHRALGLPLETIRRILDDPGFDRLEALRAQRLRLAERARATERMLRTIDETIAGLERNETMTPEALFTGFDTHSAEAEERWGETDAWADAKRRTSRYGPDEWSSLRAEVADIYKRLWARMEEGAAPDDVEDLVEAHREHLDRWFYPCSPKMHSALADLYDADPRFAANLDRHGEGLAHFLAAAIRATR